MKTYYKELDKAIRRLSVDTDKINELLAEGSSYGIKLAGEIENIRDNAYSLIDACDITEDDDTFDYIDIPPE